MGQATLTCPETAHDPPHYFIIGGNLLGLPSHGIVKVLKASEKKKLALYSGGFHLCPLCRLLLLPFPHLAEQVTSLLSIKLSYLTPSVCSAWNFPFGKKTVSSDHRLH
jgi:hypothetical protein